MKEEANVCANPIDGEQLSEIKLVTKIISVCVPGYTTSLVIFQAIISDSHTTVASCGKHSTGMNFI